MPPHDTLPFDRDPKSHVTHEEFDARFHDMRNAWAQLSRRLLWGVLIVSVLALGGVALAAVGVEGARHASDDARHASVQNQKAIGEIQASRLDSCNAQNTRNANTLKVLNQQFAAVIAQTPPSQRQAVSRQLAGTRAFTVALINTLQPHEDCNARVGIGPAPAASP
jgi:hypothetical protein